MTLGVTVSWSLQFKKTRTRLYWLFVLVTFAVLSLLATISVLGDAVEPIWEWPADVAHFFIPGLPENLIAAAMKFPMLGIILLVVVGATYWMSWLMKVEEREWAFQELRNAPFNPVPELAALMRIIATIWWAILVVFVFLAVMLLLIILLCLFSDESGMAFTPPVIQDRSPETSASCTAVCCPRRLDVDECMQVMVVANRKRNETGLFLVKDEFYMAQYIWHDEWKDGDYDVKPNGIKFGGILGLLARSVEWLRPYPEGEWFQLVGRIERGRTVFPIFNTQDASQPYQFQATGDGELVLLVNDVWYQNNSGVMKIRIQRS